MQWATNPSLGYTLLSCMRALVRLNYFSLCDPCGSWSYAYRLPPWFNCCCTSSTKPACPPAWDFACGFAFAFALALGSMCRNSHLSPLLQRFGVAKKCLHFDECQYLHVPTGLGHDPLSHRRHTG